MFTGIVEDIARISDVRESGAARTFRIATDAAFGRAKLNDGESISVNGVCLTVEQSGEGWFEVTAVRETLARTTLGSLAQGARVNLERAATAQTLLGGHIVQGHVDGTGRVISFEEGTLVVETPEDVHELCAEKGSIAVDGTSLTIA
ncbi:MAG TPA: riboflavin synthase, partial [Candidatus Krumholzibacteria bacterium]|nr:riboflavin synthase [Candidatus Krumholzibacteria bacterium]